MALLCNIIFFYSLISFLILTKVEDSREEMWLSQAMNGKNDCLRQAFQEFWHVLRHKLQPNQEIILKEVLNYQKIYNLTKWQPFLKIYVADMSCERKCGKNQNEKSAITRPG